MDNASSGTQPHKRHNPWSLSVTDITQAAVFAALIAALGLPGAINLPGGVPITLQTMGVMLAGAILGPKKGTLAVGIFMVLAIAGLPILAGGINGQASLASARGGYFLGFLPGVIVIGVLTAVMLSTPSGDGKPRYRVTWGILINLLGGLVVIYACGVAWLVIRGYLTWWAAITTNGPYVAGDVIKAVITALVAAQVHRGWPGLIEPIRLRKPSPPEP
ncbi:MULTISPECIES: biotin transporter BioY [unclassified Gordonia (in: high G+C Gram-positive bacteria)]|uniref:biotin transporter BioY n=1 Tax=unclassified Gordonia (in: high G+C Gram-positive bacteria) TaxID=2657482 RepID=UPI001F0E6A5A|nr:biotin transporter BioY [Gordonia sp. ABSL49_1]MCH5642178.1 biotin transporter BioY [Gordonia sp. ABSL49_1]